SSARGRGSRIDGVERARGDAADTFFRVRLLAVRGGGLRLFSMSLLPDERGWRHDYFNRLKCQVVACPPGAERGAQRSSMTMPSVGVFARRRVAASASSA